MRPIKLELKGFTSFREHCELNFSQLDLFAITGPTGAGKSSLLDAITYALFGRTARLGKVNAAKELLSQNALSMSVCLEFQADSQAYKVYRGLRGKTWGQLEKQSPTGEWVPETGSIKQMDAAIEEIVGLDFEGIKEEGLIPFCAIGQKDRIPRQRRHKYLRFDPGHSNVCLYRKPERQDAFLRQEYVGLQFCPFVACNEGIDNAVNGNMGFVAEMAMNHHHIVQLNEFIERHSQPVIQRLRIYQA